MKVAFDKFDITPKKPVYMAGYSRKSKSIGTLDPIEINTLAMQVDNVPIIISILDSIVIEENFVNNIKNKINKKFNIPIENIIIGCTHTHSAPAFFKLAFENTNVESELTEKVMDDIIGSITRAFNNMTDTDVEFEKTIINGIYGNRNQKNGYADKSVNIIKFYDKHHSLIGSFVNISVHPTLLNGSNFLLSADLIGFLRKKLQKEWNAPVLISNGTCGDVSTRFYRHSSSKEELEHSSSAIADQIRTSVVSKKITLSNPRIAVLSMFTVYDASKDEFNNYALDRIYKKINNVGEKEAFYLKAMASRLEIKRDTSPFKLHLTSTIVKTDDLILITMPGDVNSYFGKLIKESFPEREVIILGYTNAYVSYMVEKENYGKYFETFNTRLLKGVSDEFVKRIIEKANTI